MNDLAARVSLVPAIGCPGGRSDQGAPKPGQATLDAVHCTPVGGGGLRVIAASVCTPFLASPSDVLRMPHDDGAEGNVKTTRGKVMVAPVTISELDLHALVGIVSDERADLSPQGLPLSLLSDLTDQVRCDVVSFVGLDTSRTDSQARTVGMAPTSSTSRQ